LYSILISRAAAVQAKVAELTLHNNYRLRLKDLNYAEKIKEVEDKFQEELSTDKAKYAKLLREKEDMEGSYEERIAAFELRQAREVRLYVLIDTARLGVLQMGHGYFCSWTS
jgi:Zn-dependent oligopeptidase